MRNKTPNLAVNTQILHSIIRNSEKTQQQLSKLCGYAPTYFNGVLQTGKLSQQAFDLALYKCGIDFTPALIKEEEEEKPTPKPQAQIDTSYLLKIVEDYSYTRSNDIDRLIRAIDNLAEVIKGAFE